MNPEVAEGLGGLSRIQPLCLDDGFWAAGVVKKPIQRAGPASAWLAVTGIVPVKVVIICNSAGQRPNHIDAVDRDEFRHLLNADIGLAAQNDEPGETGRAAGAVFRLGRHRFGDAEFFEHFRQMRAARPAAEPVCCKRSILPPAWRA